jgi:hypothetical protein
MPVATVASSSDGHDDTIRLSLLEVKVHCWIEICIQFQVQNTFRIQLIKVPDCKAEVHNIYITQSPYI